MKHNRSTWHFDTELEKAGIDRRVILRVKEFLNGQTQRIKIGTQLSVEQKAKLKVPPGSIIGPLLFLKYINDLQFKISYKIRLLADCIVYREINGASYEC